MAKQAEALFLLVLLAMSPVTNAFWEELAGLAAGCVAVGVGGPLALGALGFGAGGIAGGSIAAGMMSTAATAGKGMAIVSAMQSTGAAGFGAASIAAGGLAGAGAGHTVKHLRDDKK